MSVSAQRLKYSFALGIAALASLAEGSDRNRLDCPGQMGSLVEGCHLVGPPELASTQPRHVIATIRYHFSCAGGNLYKEKMEFGVRAEDSGNTALFNFAKLGEVEVEGFGPFTIIDANPDVNRLVSVNKGCSLTADLLHVRPSAAGMATLQGEVRSQIDSINFVASIIEALASAQPPGKLAALQNDIPAKLTARLRKIENRAKAKVRQGDDGSAASPASIKAARDAADEKSFLLTLRDAIENASDITPPANIEQRLKERASQVRAKLKLLQTEIETYRSSVANQGTSDQEDLDALNEDISQALAEK